MVPNTFKSGIFLLPPIECPVLKMLTSKQMLQRLQTAPAIWKSGNMPEKMLNEIWQIIYSLYLAKKITKTVYNNINEFHQCIIQTGYYIYEFKKYWKYMILIDYYSNVQIKLT